MMVDSESVLMKQIEKSFLKFMDKLSRNQYENIEEEYLDFD